MWGTDSWGGFLWGGGPAAVPLLSPSGLIVLAVCICTIGVLLQRRHGGRWALSLLGITALVIPLIAVAGQISIPHVFQNGTVADADQVNENFDALVLESNAQDTRVTLLEAAPGPFSSCSWSSVASTGLGPTATGFCGGGNVVSGGCRLNSGSAKLIVSAPEASDGDPFTSVVSWRCTYDAVAQFNIFLLCCQP